MPRHNRATRTNSQEQMMINHITYRAGHETVHSIRATAGFIRQAECQGWLSIIHNAKSGSSSVGDKKARRLFGIWNVSESTPDEV